MNTEKTEQFVQKAIAVHGNKYDYSKVEYQRNKTKICIICPEHGEFWQTPSNHLHGNGCSKCGHENTNLSKIKPQEIFISDCQKVHGNKYDYSKVDYKGNKTKICIICPEHGEFEQLPHDHLYNQSGCPKCGRIQASNTRKRTTEQFIVQAKEIHGDNYDYSKTVYKSNHKHVEIICRKHGAFKQIASSHLQGAGCKKCANEKLSMHKTSTTQEFIDKATKLFNGFYLYDKVDYISAKNKVIITCPIHGDFKMTPNLHLCGSGCPKCMESTIERVIRQFLEQNQIQYKQFYSPKWLGRMSLDFYIPDYNIAIECQGMQHFEAIDFFGGEEGFKSTSERDQRKRQLCEENGVKLLYYSNLGIDYPYHVYEDLNELLTEIKG